LDFLLLVVAVSLDRFAEFFRIRHCDFPFLLETVLVPPECDHTVNHWRVISAWAANKRPKVNWKVTPTLPSATSSIASNAENRHPLRRSRVPQIRRIVVFSGFDLRFVFCCSRSNPQGQYFYRVFLRQRRPQSQQPFQSERMGRIPRRQLPALDQYRCRPEWTL